ncbi:hypothetical protein HMPREF0497_2717 [Lentilactobacillus buchneri ATCC 11577]|uniref:Uncharacterized protein n=1 Tax=Lentilactobacillus hilgardii (strain ATCC 8290 / DSM 20176 / CCUG 30140 / JCM 1155 / KCTC 3500 / NBRC 15886 / NCIMB 8040 / NRRL B-1843 / 9) TaxID=1423757 RepID=C0XMI8_LENH9|nr:hypothetical protein HMPREF0497_2717 [Lentilactobacillus buchneri ATCC 11577]EEI23406.1 hypothetical protein HMPREF0519_2449 [Lentilactobacillus hilgardii DSM 20176 = ATCC 8290]
MTEDGFYNNYAVLIRFDLQLCIGNVYNFQSCHFRVMYQKFGKMRD